MKKIKYIISRIFSMNFNNLFNTIKKINIKTNKNKILIFFDIIFCGIFLGAGYNDYYCFEMYNLTIKEKKSILTREKNNKYVAKFNPKKYWHEFDNKNEFNKQFDKYLKRKWFYIDNNYDEFKKFIKNQSIIIAKPNNDSGGHGIEKINVKDYKTEKDLYNYLINKKLLLLEELIIQNKELSKIYSGSVNTLRIITLNYNNKIHFITSFLRIGNNGFVDNSCSGGMLSMIDIKEGKTITPAIDFELNIYEKHPITKEEIKGFTIPYFKEAIELCRTLAKEYDKMKYIAWDIAITDKGPVIVEGNPYPGYYYQFAICKDVNKKGINNLFKDIIKEK